MNLPAPALPWRCRRGCCALLMDFHADADRAHATGFACIGLQKTAPPGRHRPHSRASLLMVRSPLIIIFLVVVPSAVLGDGVEFQLRRRQTGDAPTGRGKHLKPWLKNRKTSFRAKDTGDVVYSTDIMIGQRSEGSLCLV